MPTSRRFASSFLLLMMLAAALPAALANGLGMPVRMAPDIAVVNDPGVSDQRAGSVLFYTLYSSNTTDPLSENTRLNLTNTNPNSSVTVHLTFIDGASCTPADASVCLTPSQTMSFTAYDYDPGTVGYLVAIAIDNNGCPINFNWLIGDAFVKLGTGHAANLTAIAASANVATPTACTTLSSTAELVFDGSHYNRLPQVLSIDNIPSAVDGNSTMLVLINPTGNFMLAANPVGSFFGLMFNDVEVPSSFVWSSEKCQLKDVLSNNFPRTVPRFKTMIPAGRSGWLRLTALDGHPLLGSVINANPLAGVLPSAFNQGHNLHMLSFAPTATITIPVFPHAC